MTICHANLSRFETSCHTRCMTSLHNHRGTHVALTTIMAHDDTMLSSEAGTAVAVRGGLDRTHARNDRATVDAYGEAVMAVVAATRHGASDAVLATLHADADTLRPDGSGLANA